MMTRTTLIALVLSVSPTAPALAGEPDIEPVDFGPELPEVLDAVRLHQAVEVLTHPVALHPQFPRMAFSDRPAPFDTCARFPGVRDLDRIDADTLVYRVDLHECEISRGERVSGTLVFHPAYLDREDPRSPMFVREARAWADVSAEAWFSLEVTTETGAVISAYGERWGDLGHYEEQVDMVARREGDLRQVDASYTGWGRRLDPIDAIRSSGELLVLVADTATTLTVAAERLGRLDGDATPCMGAYPYDGAHGVVELVWTFRSRRDEAVSVRRDGDVRRMRLPHL